MVHKKDMIMDNDFVFFIDFIKSFFKERLLSSYPIRLIPRIPTTISKLKACKDT